MGLLDNFKKKKDEIVDKLPDNLDTPAELAQAAKDLAKSRKSELNDIVDKIQDAVPGTVGDNIVDAAQKKFSGKSKRK